MLQSQGLLAMLIGLIVTFSLLSPYFLQVDNFLNVGSGAAALGIMAVAQTYLIIAGGFDVSVGSVVALTGVVIGLLVGDGVNVWLASLAGLGVGAGVGAINGFIVVRLGVNPLITTLGTLSIFSGLAFTISGGSTLIVADADFGFLGSGDILGIPFCLLLLVALASVALWIERCTRTGRAIYAIGGNHEAARLAGLRTDWIPFMLYVISGLSGALAGIIITSQLAASSPQVGQTFLLSVVTAVILGGASLSGGRGSVIGTLVAVFILGILQNGFALLQLSSYVQTMAIGFALIVAVLLDQATRRLETHGGSG